MEPRTLISEVMPHYALRQIDRVAVAAGPDETWATARAVDLYRLRFVRWLVQLRTAPERARARLRGEPAELPASSRIDDLAVPGSGFFIAGERPGREVVVAAVGRFWQPAIEFANVSAAAFPTFSWPGYGKLAWCIRVDPRARGGSWLTVELRVDATDVASLRRFRRYWSVIGRFSHAIRHGVMRMLVAELGVAHDDATRPLPGDELLPGSRFDKTHAVTLEARPADVWPWLVQMGGDRAGWYSWDRLDHGGKPSADRVIPELQGLRVGDVIPALPDGDGGFAVLRLDAPSVMVLGDPSLLPGGARPADAPPWKTTWAFVLEPIGDDATRLTVRVRAAYEPSVKMALVRPLVTLAHEVMERRQLQGLRRRV